jgi:hypothetical protein
MRIHPAESRVRKLASETPATYYCFDLLVDNAGTRSSISLSANGAPYSNGSPNSISDKVWSFRLSPRTYRLPADGCAAAAARSVLSFWDCMTTKAY